MRALTRIATALERIAHALEARADVAVDTAVADEIRRRFEQAEPSRKADMAKALGARLDVDGWRVEFDRRAPKRVNLTMFGPQAAQHAFTMERSKFVELMEKAAELGVFRGGAA